MSRDIANSGDLLSVRDLRVGYRTRGQVLEAVRGVSFAIARGEVVALVGESGSGKSTIAQSIMGMLATSGQVTGGSIRYDEQELVEQSERVYRRIRGTQIGWIPQDPMVALNPAHRVGRQVAEPLRIHRLAGRREAADRAVALLERVGLKNPALRARQFPHELSGGMRQRALIAAALAAEPKLIIADEPTTALDVTVQKRILDDIEALTSSSGISVLLITHDLAVAAERADRIIVLRHGEIVEEGSAESVLGRPRDAYTKLLLASAPSLSHGRRRSPGVAVSPADAAPARPLLQVENVSKDFVVTGGKSETINAVKSVSFSIARGETLGLVGESGSGKSTVARMILGLVPPTSGVVRFDGVDIGKMSAEEDRRRRRLSQPIYQNPYASLNPRLSVAAIVSEPLKGFGLGDELQRRRRMFELLDQVGLPQSVADRRPAELSGGQRQRVAIARALAPEPELVVCDEPVSALDVSIQAQVLDLLATLQAQHRLSYLFISHDLAVVRQVADRVGVMKDGHLVEIGDADDVFRAPQHEYTRLLLDSIPGQHVRQAG